MIHLLLAVIYVSFISLGLPDSLLGAAWPSIYQGFGVPVSYSGVIFCIISVETVISSLQSDRLTRKFGAGGVTAISVAMTAAALFGFSVSNSFWALCLWAIPYELGAGSVDATPSHFGAENSQAIIGVQMASAYIGNCLMPPLFGVLANYTTIAILPYYLLAILILMGTMHETLQRREEAAR